MIAAGDDPNIKAVILVMPLLSGKDDAANFPEGSLESAWVERRERCLSSTPSPLKYIQVWDNDETEAAGHRGPILIHGDVPYKFRAGADKLSDAAGTARQNRLSLRSLYYISCCEPKDYIHRISPRPLLHLAATVDPLAGPPEEHKKAFARAGEPKEFVLLEDNHIANYFEGFEETVAPQIKFLEKYV